MSATSDAMLDIQDEGERARSDGVPFSACPYMGRGNKLAWQKGWKLMDEVMEQRKPRGINYA